jgi:RNA polymerase sigma factor (sigma-70 family)
VNEILRHLHWAGLTDGQLLECFLSRGDEGAMGALVRRHAPMVWGVCRRLLHNHHDAEDAFQATFLVFARKAAAVEPRERIANWLHGVACRTALKARAVARRRAREKSLAEGHEPAVQEPESWGDFRPLLDQELGRLPENYRVVLLLCDLEGRTRAEVARQLGWPEGTVAGRLARARALLAGRLSRRGVTLSAAALAEMLSQSTATAALPAAATVSPTTTALMEGVLRAMFLSKIKTVAVVLAVAFLGTGVALSPWLGAAQTPAKVDKKQPPPTKVEAEVKKQQAEADVQQAKAQLEVARAVLEQAKARLKLAEAELEAARAAAKTDPEEQLLRGRWKVLSAQEGGRDMNLQATPFQVSIDGVTLKDDRPLLKSRFLPGYVVLVNEATGVPESQAKYKLHPNHSPKRLELTFKNGDVLRGIYRLEGDHLTIVHTGRAGSPYPTKFISEGGKSPNFNFLLLKRLKDK